MGRTGTVVAVTLGCPDVAVRWDAPRVSPVDGRVELETTINSGFLHEHIEPVRRDTGPPRAHVRVVVDPSDPEAELSVFVSPDDAMTLRSQMNALKACVERASEDAIDPSSPFAVLLNELSRALTARGR